MALKTAWMQNCLWRKRCLLKLFSVFGWRYSQGICENPDEMRQIIKTNRKTNFGYLLL